MEEVYTQLFLPLKVTKSQFQSLLEGTKEKRLVGAKEFVIEEKVSRVNSLSLVLSGRLLVSQAGRPLHVVSENPHEIHIQFHEIRLHSRWRFSSRDC